MPGTCLPGCRTLANCWNGKSSILDNFSREYLGKCFAGLLSQRLQYSYLFLLLPAALCKLLRCVQVPRNCCTLSQRGNKWLSGARDGRSTGTSRLGSGCLRSVLMTLPSPSADALFLHPFHPSCSRQPSRCSGSFPLVVAVHAMLPSFG